MNRRVLITTVAAAAAGIALGVPSVASAATPTAQPTCKPKPRPKPKPKPTPAARQRVTGAELARVDKAINARGKVVTITSVYKNRDGSYDVQGTHAGTQVGYRVSADLKTITDLVSAPK